MTNGMMINRQVVAFDAAVLAAESRFWAAPLGDTVDAEDDWHMVFVDSRPRVGVHLAPDHIAPGSPDNDEVCADTAGRPLGGLPR